MWNLADITTTVDRVLKTKVLRKRLICTLIFGGLAFTAYMYRNQVQDTVMSIILSILSVILIMASTNEFRKLRRSMKRLKH